MLQTQSVRGQETTTSAELARFIAGSIDAAVAADTPFPHLVIDRIFPDDVYARMLDSMPSARDYRPMHGRSKGHDLADGTHTRVKIDLFPEYIRHLPDQKRAVWRMVGQALCSDAPRIALMRKLATGLQRRFGPGYAEVGMYPIPMLTRDVTGYEVFPHKDSRWKGITMQLYLPRDESISHVGTIFHEELADGTLVNRAQMKFLPNSGYAFAVGEDTWHSADPVGPEVDTRDSILQTYFVDSGAVRILRNRGKRFGNFMLNEMRARLPR